MLCSKLYCQKGINLILFSYEIVRQPEQDGGALEPADALSLTQTLSLSHKHSLSHTNTHTHAISFSIYVSVSLSVCLSLSLSLYLDLMVPPGNHDSHAHEQEGRALEPADAARELLMSRSTFISKHLSFINLLQGNSLHRTIFTSNVKVDV